MNENSTYTFHKLKAKTITSQRFSIKRLTTSFGVEYTDCRIINAQPHQCDFVLETMDDEHGYLINYHSAGVFVNHTPVPKFTRFEMYPNSILQIANSHFFVSKGSLPTNAQSIVDSYFSEPIPRLSDQNIIPLKTEDSNPPSLHSSQQVDQSEPLKNNLLITSIPINPRASTAKQEFKAVSPTINTENDDVSEDDDNKKPRIPKLTKATTDKPSKKSSKMSHPSDDDSDDSDDDMKKKKRNRSKSRRSKSRHSKSRHSKHHRRYLDDPYERHTKKRRHRKYYSSSSFSSDPYDDSSYDEYSRHHKKHHKRHRRRYTTSSSCSSDETSSSEDYRRPNKSNKTKTRIKEEKQLKRNNTKELILQEVTSKQEDKQNEERLYLQQVQNVKKPKTMSDEDKMFKGHSFYFGVNIQLSQKYSSVIKKYGGKVITGYPTFPNETLPPFEDDGMWHAADRAKQLINNFLIVEKENEGPTIPYFLCIISQVPVVVSTFLDQIKRKKKVQDISPYDYLAPVIPLCLSKSSSKHFGELHQPFTFHSAQLEHKKKIRFQVPTLYRDEKPLCDLFIRAIGGRIVDRQLGSSSRPLPGDGSDHTVYSFIPVTEESHVGLTKRRRSSLNTRCSENGEEEVRIYLDWVIEMMKKQHFIFPKEFTNPSERQSQPLNSFDNI
ncbi:FHA domain-containing protein [Entamoeba marina]